MPIVPCNNKGSARPRGTRSSASDWHSIDPASRHAQSQFLIILIFLDHTAKSFHVKMLGFQSIHGAIRLGESVDVARKWQSPREFTNETTFTDRSSKNCMCHMLGCISWWKLCDQSYDKIFLQIYAESNQLTWNGGIVQLIAMQTLAANQKPGIALNIESRNIIVSTLVRIFTVFVLLMT